jgi:hypothetical protein
MQWYSTELFMEEMKQEVVLLTTKVLGVVNFQDSFHHT